MKLRGSLVVIICCCLLQFSNLIQKRYLFTFTPWFGAPMFECFQGLLYLVYPFLGHLADVYLTRHRMLKCGLIMVLIGAISISVPLSLTYFIESNPKVINQIVSVLLMISTMTPSIGIGLFEANAIQFGLDQLLEAPTPKLIYWYYWSQNVGGLVMFYVISIGHFILSANVCSTTRQYHHLVCMLLLTGSVLLIFSVILMLVMFHLATKDFYIQRAGLNPFKNIYRVLNYTWNHKVPERRSAFTYWEGDIPPRIDLGKEKYGGPFTTEEVEDTKTFPNILPLLLCLFGYHLAGDDYSAPEQLQRTSCPSLLVQLLIIANPLHVSALVTVVGIPMYELVIVKIFPRIKNILMLTKMWIGLYLSLIQIVIYIIYIGREPQRHKHQH